MKFVFLLLVVGFPLLEAADPKAIAEANRAVALAHEGKYNLAVQHYRSALVLDPTLPGLHLNLGLAYFKLNQFPDAAAQFELAAKAAPADFQTTVLLGMSYYGCRRFSDAADQFSRASTQQPDNDELRLRLAQSYMWSKQYDRAKVEFQFLLARNPDSAPVHILLGEVLDAAKEQDKAISEFEAAVKVAPHDPDAHFGLGYLYWKQKRFPDARREFLAVLNDQPQHTQALTYCADAEMQIGDENAAQEHLRLAIKFDPNIRLAHLDLGILLLKHNELQDAAAQFREAIRVDPTSSDAHYRLARLLLAMHRDKEANAEFEKVKKLAIEQAPAPIVDIAPRNTLPPPQQQP